VKPRRDYNGNLTSTSSSNSTPVSFWNREIGKVGGFSVTPTKVAIGTVAVLATVAVVGGGVWWLGHKKGWWKKSSTQPPSPSPVLTLEGILDDVERVAEEANITYGKWGMSSDDDDNDLGGLLIKVQDDAKDMRNVLLMRRNMRKDEVMTLLETLLKSARELTMQVKNEKTKTKAANMLELVLALKKNVKRFPKEFLESVPPAV
ncbi:MAG: hypothetical protein LE180_05615, partial [Endomicrobium sp.]|uniref:hypothetical protein n=1 Tax=Candidatus Endomicrobiellum pyrsonymphae TaxID=1408203 RepID=UPI003584BAE6|nr:hypothetical protein [Endomicrobium sp.]